MKTVSFYLVRHGKTLFNQLDRMQGWCDSPLTEEGRTQALNLGVTFKESNLKFTSVYTSDTGRAFETASIVAAQSFNYEHIKRRKNLREICFGLMEGEKTAIAHKGRNTSFEVDWTDVEGEKMTDVSQRMHTEINTIYTESEAHENILIVSHGASILAFLSNFQEFDINSVINGRVPPLKNCGAIHFQINDGQVKFINSGGLF